MRTATDTFQTDEDYARMQRYWAQISDGAGVDGLAPDGATEAELAELQPHLRRIVGLYRIAIDDLLEESTYRRFLAILAPLDAILDRQAGEWLADFKFDFNSIKP